MIRLLSRAFPNGEVRVEIENEEGALTVNLTTALSSSPDLATALEQHASRYAWWAAIRCECEDQRDHAALQLDRTQSELFEHFRAECKAEGLAATLTEKVIKMRTAESPRVKQASDALHFAESYLRVAEAAVKSFEARRHMLERLADRSRQDWLGERAPEDAADRMRKAIKR
jgi:hypothetical protein